MLSTKATSKRTSTSRRWNHHKKLPRKTNSLTQKDARTLARRSASIVERKGQLSSCPKQTWWDNSTPNPPRPRPQTQSPKAAPPQGGFSRCNALPPGMKMKNLLAFAAGQCSAGGNQDGTSSQKATAPANFFEKIGFSR